MLHHSVLVVMSRKTSSSTLRSTPVDIAARSFSSKPSQRLQPVVGVAVREQ